MIYLIVPHHIIIVCLEKENQVWVAAVEEETDGEEVEVVVVEVVEVCILIAVKSHITHFILVQER